MTEKIPEYIKKYKTLSKKAQKMIDTTNLEHNNAFVAGTEAIKDEEGLVDYEQLDDVKKQEEFAEKMIDHYVSKAKQELGANPKDKLENTMLMKAYSGVTEYELKRAVADNGKDFTLDMFNTRIKPRYMNEVTTTLKSASASHLKEEHIPDIVKHTKSEKFINPNKLKLEEAVAMIDEFNEKGVVSPKDHKGKRYSIKEYYK